MLTGCATGTIVQQSTGKISEPKVIALDAPSAPWVAQIEKRLREKGFTIKRISRERTGALSDVAARYVLVLNGSYQTGWDRRCFGGGYMFDSINAELVDMSNNESIASISGEGYSEGCPPLSGSIYGDITKAIVDNWR